LIKVMENTLVKSSSSSSSGSGELPQPLQPEKLDPIARLKEREAVIKRHLYVDRHILLNQCCGSGMFYPGSGSDHCSIPDPDPTIAPSRIRGVKKNRIPDPDPQH
jgi:hypothetical protein